MVYVFFVFFCSIIKVNHICIVLLYFYIWLSHLYVLCFLLCQRNIFHCNYLIVFFYHCLNSMQFYNLFSEYIFFLASKQLLQFSNLSSRFMTQFCLPFVFFYFCFFSYIYIYTYFFGGYSLITLMSLVIAIICKLFIPSYPGSVHILIYLRT